MYFLEFYKTKKGNWKWLFRHRDKVICRSDRGYRFRSMAMRAFKNFQKVLADFSKVEILTE